MHPVISLITFLLMVTLSQCDPEQAARAGCRGASRMTEDEAFDAMCDSIDCKTNIPGYKRTRIIPWKVVKKIILGIFPTSLEKYDETLQRWSGEMKKLINELHTIDTDWIYYKELESNDQLLVKFLHNNGQNKKDCEDAVKDLVNRAPRSDEDIQSSMSLVCRCMFSAPANIRPGFTRTSEYIGGSYLDPLLPKRVAMATIVKMKDLTKRSQQLAELVKYKEYSESDGGGIMTSDQECKIMMVTPMKL